jgi:hypothetical protein
MLVRQVNPLQNSSNDDHNDDDVDDVEDLADFDHAENVPPTLSPRPAPVPVTSAKKARFEHNGPPLVQQRAR